MKKRIFAVVVLLCTMVCLVGCDSKQWSKTELQSISYEYPSDWYTDDWTTDKQHYLIVDEQTRYMIRTWFYGDAYESPIDYINHWATLGVSFISVGDITIAGGPSYTCTFLAENGFLIESYAFETSDGVYAIIFEDQNGEEFPDDIRDHVLNSIQINA